MNNSNEPQTALSAEQQWQNEEDERLEYEGYCNKIRQGLDDNVEKSGERAIWELIQNARDLSQNAKIKIELTSDCLIFSHHGLPFDYTSFRALVKQDSSKDRTGTDLVGQYGTGFMTTHIFNRLVYVTGPYAVKKSKEEISGYVQIKDFALDRSKVDTTEGPRIMKEQLMQVKGFCNRPLDKEIKDDTTSFRYGLTSNQIDNISKQLGDVIRLMPLVLIINERIEEVEIDDRYAKKHFLFKKSNEKKVTQLSYSGWSEFTGNVIQVNHTNGMKENYDCKNLQSDKGDIIIIPPFPKICGDVDQIPSLFLWFPLLGTEHFGVNFIFHSQRFYPVEKRNNIMLPKSSNDKTKGNHNALVLKEMMEALFNYYSVADNASNLPRKMCEVSFPKFNDDEETQKFYNDLQELWINNIKDWKVIPHDGKHYSITDPTVRLLHPSFYETLPKESRCKYEKTLAGYALLPKRPDGQSFLMPAEDLIGWSETVNNWRYKDTTSFFISIQDVCRSIKTKTEELHDFLMLMKENGKLETIVNEYPLLPNRNGMLRKRGELSHGDFMSNEIYELVKVVMGSDADTMFDRDFLDICEVGNYTTDNLRRAINSTMGDWRRKTLKDNIPLTVSESDALIRFCSASSQDDFNNQRGRLMPILTPFYGVAFEQKRVIKLQENEEDFYDVPFNLLLEYTLLKISNTSSEWLDKNKDWLFSFLQEYTSSRNEDKLKKLDDYDIIPCQRNYLCKAKDLHRNAGVPTELAEIYRTVFEKDLHKQWVDEKFENLLDFEEDSPKEIAEKIEKQLVDDMKQEHDNRHFEKIVREIILHIRKDKSWESWFSQISEKKAIYTFDMTSIDAQGSLFSLMDLEENDLARLATLNKDGNLMRLLDEAEKLRQKEMDKKARFDHLHKIGRYIEDCLRQKFNSTLVKIESSANIEDDQEGQDLTISVNMDGHNVEVYYVEVKSKWDFSEPAHMSTLQIQKAVNNSEKYALCCVDLRQHKNENLLNLSEDTICRCTKVKMKIGEELRPLVNNIIKASKESEDKQIKISEYRSNMSATIFEQGESLDCLIAKIETVIKEQLSQIRQNANLGSVN